MNLFIESWTSAVYHSFYERRGGLPISKCQAFVSMFVYSLLHTRCNNAMHNLYIKGDSGRYHARYSVPRYEA
jgi:hypothetical protein